MLDALIRFSLQQRMLVAAVACLLTAVGVWQSVQLPIDVFPDLNRPRVVILTEAPGMAPEEIETLITVPLETAMNGAAGVEHVRSSSGIGISVVYVEFAWGTSVMTDRQVVAERLQSIRDQLPPGITPQLAPAASIMGQILVMAMWNDRADVTPMQLRTAADWILSQRLRAIPGVSQVIVMGGERRQYQVLADPVRLQFKQPFDCEKAFEYAFGVIHPIDADTLFHVCSQVKEIHELGVQVGVVIGGGNIFRGLNGEKRGVDRTTGDYMGMLATVINGLALMDCLEKLGVSTRVQLAIPMNQIAEPFILRRAMRHLEKGRVVIFVAGTGNPYFSTDTTAALRASEMHADIIMKAGTVVWSPVFRTRNISVSTEIEQRLGIPCRVANDANMIAEGLIAAAGYGFFPDRIDTGDHMRLSFSWVSEDELVEAAQRLATACAKVAERHQQA